MKTLKEEILQLRSEGLNYKQIVERTGCAKSTVSYYCGTDQRDKYAVRQRDRRSKVRKFLQEVKTASPCVDCGENYPYWVMQFDHVRGEKSFNLSAAPSSATGNDMELIKEEIAKCDIVCANCHADRTHFRIVKGGGDTMDLDNEYT